MPESSIAQHLCAKYCADIVRYLTSRGLALHALQRWSQECLEEVHWDTGLQRTGRMPSSLTSLKNLSPRALLVELKAQLRNFKKRALS